VVTVTRIDRLARSSFDLFGIVKGIVNAKAQFRSLAEPWADTGTSPMTPVPPLDGSVPRVRQQNGLRHRHTIVEVYLDECLDAAGIAAM
jgi:hypothetical protein